MDQFVEFSSELIDGWAVRGGEGVRNGPDARIEAELEAVGNGWVFVLQAGCVEVSVPRMWVIG